MNLYVPVGKDAQIAIPAPNSDGGLEWQLRYGNPVEVRYAAASAIASYSYLVLECSDRELLRRAHILRKAYNKATKKEGK